MGLCGLRTKSLTIFPPPAHPHSCWRLSYSAPAFSLLSLYPPFYTSFYSFLFWHISDILKPTFCPYKQLAVINNKMYVYCLRIFSISLFISFFRERGGRTFSLRVSGILVHWMLFGGNLTIYKMYNKWCSFCDFFPSSFIFRMKLFISVSYDEVNSTILCAKQRPVKWEWLMLFKSHHKWVHLITSWGARNPLDYYYYYYFYISLPLLFN